MMNACSPLFFASPFCPAALGKGDPAGVILAPSNTEGLEPSSPPS